MYISYLERIWLKLCLLHIFFLNIYSGYLNGNLPDGKDVGPYECPEVKVMNHMQARLIPEMELTVHQSRRGRNRREGETICVDGVERTAL